MNKKMIIQLSSIIGWIVMIGLLGFLASRWSLFWSYIQYGGNIHCFFWGDMVENCCFYSLVTIKEEIIFRFLPFFVASIIVVLLKSKNAKRIVITLCFIIIIMIQLQFGYMHFHPENSATTYWYHVKLQGGLGILLAIIYGLTFYVTMKKLYKKSKYPILTFVICHVLAILAAISVHAINNILIVIAQSY